MLKRGAVLIVLAMIIVIGVLHWRENRHNDAPVQTVTASAGQLARGRYLTRAADCAACHSLEDGNTLAGGYPVKTPFGTIYGSNLTPSPDDGIGRWTRDDFYQALTEGIAPGGRHLYPAMPYTSYKAITRQDSDDIYAWLMSRPAVNMAPPQNDLPFPFNQRMAMIGWKLLFFSRTPLPAVSQGESADWQRGRYLVDVLGHCGECHTPRGQFGQLILRKSLQGGEPGRFSAPDITPAALAQRGWRPADLNRFLATGLAPQGSAFSDMNMVVDLSTRYLSAADRQALVTYLVGDTPAPALAVAGLPAGGQANPRGEMLYLDQCSGCHARDGEGKPHVAVALANNATLRQPDSRNLIISMLDGLPASSFPDDERMQSMPAFDARLSDEDIATLANYLRVRWGGQPASVTPQQVQKLRQQK